MAALLLTLDGVLYQVQKAGGSWLLLALQGKRVGARYAVHEGGCDCPAAQFRAGPCKHRLALGTLGLLPAVAERVPTPEEVAGR